MPPKRSRFHAVHKQEIEQRIHRYVDRRRDAAPTGFIVSMLFFSFAVSSLISRPTAVMPALSFLGVSLVFFLLYLLVVYTLRKEDGNKGWISIKEHLFLGFLFTLAACLPGYGGAQQIGLSLISIYTAWRFWKIGKVYWRVYYFRVGRAYMREVRAHLPQAGNTKTSALR